MAISKKRLREIEQESGCLYFQKDGLKKLLDQAFEKSRKPYSMPIKNSKEFGKWIEGNDE